MEAFGEPPSLSQANTSCSTQWGRSANGLLITIRSGAASEKIGFIGRRHVSSFTLSCHFGHHLLKSCQRETFFHRYNVSSFTVSCLTQAIILLQTAVDIMEKRSSRWLIDFVKIQI